MRKSRFSEEQIIGLLKEAEALERLAAQHQAVAGQLRQLAPWVRRRVHRGPPEPSGGGLGVGQGPGEYQSCRQTLLTAAANAGVSCLVW